jgi:hypothetical protein
LAILFASGFDILRVNQALHERQEQMYQQKVAMLQAAYDEKLKQLLIAAERSGVLPELIADQHLLIEMEART